MFVNSYLWFWNYTDFWLNLMHYKASSKRAAAVLLHQVYVLDRKLY